MHQSKAICRLPLSLLPSRGHKVPLSTLLLICPAMLDHGCCVWAPYQLKYGNLLKNAQYFARLDTKRWSQDPAMLRAQLGWPLLENRQKFMKVCLTRRILGGESLIPTTSFSDHPSTSTRHANLVHFFNHL